ncbi:MAG TPA: hypothetical protein DCZ71_04655 [Ruminococcus sp.]|nr:hypothetical protein [Ruminococcus sp.]
MNDEFKMLIKSVPDTYEDFERWVFRAAETYEGYAEYIINYLKDHPDATTSDIAAYEEPFLRERAE